MVVGGGCTNNGSNGSGGPCENSRVEASLPKDSRTWACGMENCNDVLAKAICVAATPVGSLTVEKLGGPPAPGALCDCYLSQDTWIVDRHGSAAPGSGLCHITRRSS